MRRYDYSFIKGLKIGTDVMAMTNMIEAQRIREQERKKNSPDVFSSLEGVARVQSVKGSNEIEGIVTTDKRIEEIVNRNSAPLDHNEMEIAGYRDVLNMIHNGHGSMGITEETILNMHRIMMSYTPNGGGRYKNEDNLIINADRNGKQSVRFRPVPSNETASAMEQLILAYNSAKDDSRINRMILIPCFILDLLCIHPFSDGNGRMSRLLSILLMYRSNIDVGRYISFEEQINRSKGSYYEALGRSSEEWHTNDNDYIPFIENFIFMLFRCYKELDRRFAVIGDVKINKGNRIEAAVLNCIEPISKTEIKELLPDVSVKLIEVKLSELLRDEKIRKIGSYRDARYFRR
jgi:hypothetical protein